MPLRRIKCRRQRMHLTGVNYDVTVRSTQDSADLPIPKPVRQSQHPSHHSPLKNVHPVTTAISTPSATDDRVKISASSVSGCIVVPSTSLPTASRRVVCSRRRSQRYDRLREPLATSFRRRSLVRFCTDRTSGFAFRFRDRKRRRLLVSIRATS